MSGTVRLTMDGPVAVVTLNRPQAANAVDVEMAEALMDASIACDRNPTVRAVLVRAEGRFFSAGGDVAVFASAGESMPGMLLKVTGLVHSAMSRFARMEKPLVTAIQGFAAGIGFSLAMLGDIVVAGSLAKFSLAYTRIGLTPDGGATWLLPRLVGMRRAQEMILLNPTFDAGAALAAGLVTEVVADDQLQVRSHEVARRLAAGPSRALGRARTLLISSFNDSFEGHLEREARAIADSATTADGVEGVAAFAAKRDPSFTGR